MDEKTAFDCLTLYIFGTFIQDHNFCNAIIDSLIDLVTERKAYPAGLASLAYSELPPSSPFIKLLVDF